MQRKMRNGRVFCRNVLTNLSLMALILASSFASRAFAQVDQGTITGVVQDTSDAVIPNAEITLTNTDTGLILKGKSNGSGVFVFSPIKIGHYTVSASAPNFQRMLQQNLILHLSQTLSVPLTLKPGSVSETGTVTSAPPLLENQKSTVSQTFSSETIESTPLAERNWVYMAQLSTGVVPSYGTRSGSHGDYGANGQRAEQNDYVLDGVDNNVDIVNYMNGTMYAVSPPPDALSEFNSMGGLITLPVNLQANVPDARIFQLSAKYMF